MRFRLVAFLLALVLAASACARQQMPKVGDVAPRLTIETWLQGSPVAGFEKGKVYVIEFWATWCGSCHAAMPHLNELVRAMKGKPVVFVSVTDEERGIVEAFMKTKAFETAVALDGNGKAFAAYGATVLPHTIVVDANCKIAAITRPEAVTKEAIQELLDGKSIDLPVKSNKRADLNWDANLSLTSAAPEEIGHAVLQLSDAVSGAISMPPGTGRITGDGAGLRALIQAAYGSSFTNTSCTLANPDRGPYRISIKAPDGKDETARAMMQDILRRSFAFKADWREVDWPVAVLKYDPSKSSPNFKKSSAQKSDGSAEQGHIGMVRVPVVTLVKLISGFGLAMEGVDETGLSDRFDLDLRWIPGDRESFLKSLAETGLVLSIEKRKTRVLFIEPD